MCSSVIAFISRWLSFQIMIGVFKQRTQHIVEVQRIDKIEKLHVLLVAVSPYSVKFKPFFGTGLCLL